MGPVHSNRASGFSNSILGLAKGQASMGHNVAVLPSQPPGLSEKMVPASITLLPSPKARHLNPWKLSKGWIKIIRENFGRPDVVNFHSTYIPFQTALAELFIMEGWCYVVAPRGGLTRLAQGIKFLRKRIRNLLFFNHFVNNAKAIHALCEREAADIRFFYPNARIFIAPNGVDESLLSLASRLNPKELKGFREQGDLVIGFVGRIDVYHKGIDLLLLSLKLLQDKGLGKNIKLLMVGSFYTPNDECRVRTLMNSLRFPDNVMFIGSVYGQDKWRLLMACDVFGHASRFEGMPMAVLEAMAFGKPCIVTPGTNMQDIVCESNGGWLCDESIDSIANTLLQVEKQKEEIPQRGINAKKYVREHVTWPIVAQQWLANVSEILNVGG